MISIQVMAFILLIFRLVAVFFIGSVIIKQIKLFKKKIAPEVRVFRIVLFMVALAVLVGNIIPIVVDGITLLTDVPRSPFLSPLSTLYAVSNATTAVLSSSLIWALYRISDLSNKE